jgi:threonine dehydrogenase-like Zn-dependent dehydrogenase
LKNCFYDGTLYKLQKVKRMRDYPEEQYAVQLVGPDGLILNKRKPVVGPGPHQILARVEAVGLCFSDLKLLKQFSEHVRKGPIVGGIEEQILKEIPSYVPGDRPTVPGHESVVTIEAVGEGVERFRPGERYLVETDYRWLPTDGSNAAFGYNFEGALQEYVLMDERVITSPEGQSMLIPAPEGLSASEIALVEPFACVEHSYREKQRKSIQPDSNMLIAAEVKPENGFLQRFFARYGRPQKLTWLGAGKLPGLSGVQLQKVSGLSSVQDFYDDIIYFGSDVRTAERLFDRLSANGLFNIVFCGGRFEGKAVTPVGRIHYSGVRVTGTCGFDPAEAMKHIPETGEICDGDKVNIIGAGGPMGMMHILRDIGGDRDNIEIFGGDIDDERLSALSKVVGAAAGRRNIFLRLYNSQHEEVSEAFNYTAVLAPVPELIDMAVQNSAANSIINIFAGIAAEVTAEVSLDAYIEKRLYFVGTSGSVLEDMRRILDKVTKGIINTNTTVAAVSGLAGAVEAIRAVEARSIPGKIIVYPACRDLPLIRLDQMKDAMPKVAECLNEGLWTRQAEQKLFRG